MNISVMQSAAFLGGIGWMEITIILLALLLLFGGKKLPELARNLGKGLSEFKKGVQNSKDEFEKALNEEDESQDEKSTEDRSESTKTENETSEKNVS